MVRKQGLNISEAKEQDMNKSISILLAAVLLFALSSCTDKEQYSEISGSEEVLSVFSGCMHPDDIIRDTGNVDLNLKPDFKGLTKKVTKNEENDTSEENWFDSKSRLIYTVYKGYGEDSFDYFTKSKSGDKITATYYLDDEGITRRVGICSDRYTLTYYSLNDDDSDAEIYISEYKPENHPESITYRKSGSKWLAESAYYYNNEGLYRYWGVSEDGAEDYGSEIIAERQDSIVVSDVSKLRYAFPLQFRAGAHDLTYTETDGKKDWYLTASFIVQFDDFETAKKCSEELGLPEPGYDDLDGETPQIITDPYTVKLSKDFSESEAFQNFITMEINDDYSLILELNDEDEITGFNSGYVQFY